MKNLTFTLCIAIGITTFIQSQNVGIGTQTPLKPLHIVDGADYQTVRFQSSHAIGAGINLMSPAGNYTLLSANIGSGAGTNNFGIFNENSQKYNFVLRNDGWLGLNAIPLRALHTKDETSPLASMALEGQNGSITEYYPLSWNSGRKAFTGFNQNNSDFAITNEFVNGNLSLNTNGNYRCKT